MVLNEEWTADVVGRLHRYRIQAKELAARCGYDPAYLSTVMNGRKDFGGVEAAEKTKERILSTLDQMIEERLKEVEEHAGDDAEPVGD